MNDIQEAWIEYLTKSGVPASTAKALKSCIPDNFASGYQAGIDSLKCCGCCKWYGVYANGFIEESESGQWCTQLRKEVGYDGCECKGSHFTPRSKE